MDQRTARKIDALLQALGDLLDPEGEERRVLRAYMAAQNAMASLAGPAEEMATLAAKLSAAAGIAEQIADLTRG
ncbi:hypothetical protein ACGFJT_37375 [Actinomadura geliboluensis]|uniref:hypothetical protein n=1 Tax=Actinomadura geliboluensis TaxID=882440 RepID=UPI0037119CE2